MAKLYSVAFYIFKNTLSEGVCRQGLVQMNDETGSEVTPSFDLANTRMLLLQSMHPKVAYSLVMFDVPEKKKNRKKTLETIH